MAFTAPKTKIQRPLPDADTHVARLYSIVDIGSHKSDWQGKANVLRKVVLTFELPNATHVFDEKKGPEPFSISQTYTLSMGKKSNLRADVEAWVGKFATDEEAWAFDISKLLGQSCFLNIDHEEKNGITYANIAGIVKLPKGVTCPPPVNKYIVYQIEDRKGGNFTRLHKWLQDKISASLEFTEGDSQPDAPEDDRPPVDDTQADEYAAELEAQEKERNR